MTYTVTTTNNEASTYPVTLLGTAQDIPELYVVCSSLATQCTLTSCVNTEDTLRVEYNGIVICQGNIDSLVDNFHSEYIEHEQQRQQEQTTADIIEEYEAELSERINNE